MKERLTGAIIVVALLVLLVPELLTGPESKSAAKPAGDESAPVRTYTIDLADNPNANRRSNPALAPETAVTDEPVAQATPDVTEPEVEQPEVAAVEESPAKPAASAESASSDLGVAHGSSADSAAAGRAAGASGSSSGSAAAKPAAAETERPRSAFGPGAASRAEPSRQAAASSAPAPARQAESPAPRAAASSGSSKGSWSVQLGAFGSRENAERLVKQVKGKGFPVAINENASSKLRYRVRVGPEKDRAAADAVAAKLRAAGHKDATVVPAG